MQRVWPFLSQSILHWSLLYFWGLSLMEWRIQQNATVDANILGICIKCHFEDRNFILIHNPTDFISGKSIVIVVSRISESDKLLLVVLHPLFIHKVKMLAIFLALSWFTGCVGNQSLEFMWHVPVQVEDECGSSWAGASHQDQWLDLYVERHSIFIIRYQHWMRKVFQTANNKIWS